MIHHSSFIRPSPFGQLCFLLLLGSLMLGAAGSAAASLGTTAKSPLPTLAVPSNGVAYSSGPGITSEVFQFKVLGDAGWGRLVKNLSYEASAGVSFSGGVEVDIGTSSDPGFIALFDQKRKARLDGTLSPSASALGSACNLHAGKLRDEGLSDAQIFGQDRTITVSVSVASEMDIVAAGFDDQDLATFSLDLVCKKSGGSGIPGQANQLTAKQGVHNAELALVEESNLAGLCRVKLNSTIETTAPLMEVKFRYEHGDGQQSDVKTITTSPGGLALISDTIPIPNGPGQEAGTMRIVGVSPSFTSNVAAYAMDCGSAGTAFQVSLAPSATLQGGPIGAQQRNGQICPTHLNLQGRIEGQGGGTTEGKAYFLGPQVESPFETFNVNGGQSVFVNHLVPLVWNAGPQFAGQQAAAPALMSQAVVVGFHVMGENNSEVAQVPQRAFQIACERPPSTTGGFGQMAPIAPSGQPRLPAAQGVVAPQHRIVPPPSSPALRPRTAPGATQTQPIATPTQRSVPSAKKTPVRGRPGGLSERIRRSVAEEDEQEAEEETEGRRPGLRRRMEESR